MVDATVRISIIIPVKPAGLVAALAALRSLDYPEAAYEVLVAEGRRPSVQRNRAAEAARGDLVYFLDDDSLVRQDALQQIVAAMADPAVAVVGGPSLTPASDTPFQQAIGYVLRSVIGGGGVRNRYRLTGVRRPTDDRELILCNLSFRRELFLAAGGLDERLYPNEENELLDRLRTTGHTMLHDPELAVQRSQRPTIRAFVRQMYGYGIGRGEQTRISRCWRLTCMIPPVFLGYLLSALIFHPWWYLLPLASYLLLVGGAAVHARLTESVPGIGLRVAAIAPAMHLLYGAGTLKGLLFPRFARMVPAAAVVTIRQVKEFDRPWPEMVEDPIAHRKI